MAFLSVGMVAAALAASGADRKYSAIDLGTLPGGALTLAYAINNRSQVVGVSYIAGDSHAFLWERGTMTDLGIPPGRRHAAAADINNHGQIVGSTSAEFAHAVMWDDGSMIDLGMLPGATSCAAHAIDDRAQIVGSCERSERRRWRVSLGGRGHAPSRNADRGQLQFSRRRHQ